ncbi:Glucose-1-phosphate thymidylyltransferase, long form [Oceanicaulis sp. HTCC2633]|uniref:glucose-1-phosphate thymidylyltransferase RfbA n=1 Tax=Oceanicaulis sp. HTCC2633 TaxID=314254 RepID=UPI000066A2A9|nr:Glucose-1-phosphate thymidylyltransferase, long form [Oceanicaulis sp. HTCC2633]
MQPMTHNNITSRETSHRKGILLAGGLGTRLAPLTQSVSKQLLPIYDKPLVFYPLSTLMLAGIKDVLVISTPDHIDQFKRLLGDGSDWNMHISYQVQAEPKGVAEALILAESWLDGAPSLLALGDNILHSTGLTGLLLDSVQPSQGATIFAFPVQDPSQFGVVDFDENGAAISLEEKPSNPRSEWAVTGLYVYDETASQKARSLSPSTRGELEITDLNKLYLSEKTLNVVRFPRGTTWLDTGTLDGLVTASEWVRATERQNGFKIACPEEIAWRNGWISREQLAAISLRYKNEYGAYLKRLSDSSKS